MFSTGQNLRRRYLVAIAGWLVCSTAIALLLWRMNAASYLRLTQHATTAPGFVIAREPANHDSVVVRFTANGVEHLIRRSHVAKPNKEKSQLAVGDEVTVYFLVRDPLEATIGDPGELLPDELIAIGLAATIFPTLLVGGLLWRTRARFGRA